MLFTHLLLSLVFVVVLGIFFRLIWQERPLRELRDIALVIIREKMVKTVIRDRHYLEARYALNMGEEKRSPLVIYRHYCTGEEEIQLVSGGKQPLIENYGAHAIALLEEALADIKRGVLVDKMG